MICKTDLHIHVKGDPEDLFVRHSAKEVIDRAEILGFKCLSVTLHNKQYFPRSLVKYASKKGILLVPGTERYIEGKHVLLFNFPSSIVNHINNFSDLRKFKGHNQLVIAPHPFYPHHRSISLQRKFVDNIDVFDGVEYCHFFTSFWNSLNKKALSVANFHKLPMIANSDTHALWMFGRHFSEVEMDDFSVSSFVSAVKNRRINACPSPLSGAMFIRELCFLLLKRDLSWLRHF